MQTTIKPSQFHYIVYYIPHFTYKSESKAFCIYIRIHIKKVNLKEVDDYAAQRTKTTTSLTHRKKYPIVLFLLLRCSLSLDTASLRMPRLKQETQANSNRSIISQFAVVLIETSLE